MAQEWLFTSESVAAGHPDKLCDAISDAIVDACLALDPKAKVAVETLVKGREDRSYIVLAGEVKLAAGVDAPDYVAIARKTAAAIGYTSHGIGMDATSEDLCEVKELITSQSAHINQGSCNPSTTKVRATKGSCSVMPATRPRATPNTKAAGCRWPSPSRKP